MYAWEKIFSTEDIISMIHDAMEDQSNEGYSIMMARLKGTGEPIGRAGLRRDKLHGKDVVEIAYMLAKKFWGQGMATELAEAWLQYAFEKLNADEVYAEVRPSNKPSIAVVERLGMKQQNPAWTIRCRGRDGCTSGQ